jgi:hypothetical protein
MENKHFKQIENIWGEKLWVDINQLTAYARREVDDEKSVAVWFSGLYVVVEKEVFDEIMEDLIHGGDQN